MANHDGHRARMRERFRGEGLDHFSEHEVLELLLYYSIPRINTNEIAHELLERFGSLSQVLDAQPEELERVEGIGASSATFLSLISQVVRYYHVNRMEHETILDTIEKCGRYLVPFFYGRRNETVFLLCLDAKCKLLCCRELGEGSVNSAGVPVRKIVEVALGSNASSVVLAHNHPSGLALPSMEDMLTTRRVSTALDAVEITLVDHIVVADGDYVSMIQSGCYRPEECRLNL